MKIYAAQITSRLQYACNILFKVILNTEYVLSSAIENTSDITINYSNEEIKGVFQIIPSGLLEQTGISSHDLKPGEFEGHKTLFHSGKGSIQFDIFSAVFYMCSRYEEYLPFEADEHGRFRAENSTAYRFGFINEPIVEQWTQKLCSRLKLAYPNNNYKFNLTIDVDDAWMYKNRPCISNIGNLTKSLLTFKIKEFWFRLAVLLNKKPDPWFTFDYLEGLEKRLDQPIQYFFLLGRKSAFDRAISFKRKAFRSLLQKLQAERKVGMHPSYASNFSEEQLNTEFYALSSVNTSKPLHSRQHYLKLSFPETFNKLIKLGIREEYSMGWPSQAGFRAGISRPFPFYNLSAEKETHLLFVPFMVMDRTLKDYMNLSTLEAMSQIKSTIEKVKAVGGQYTMLWHNDSISNFGEWEGWREVFEEAINLGRAK
jgi:hypothetical protein